MRIKSIKHNNTKHDPISHAFFNMPKIKSVFFDEMINLVDDIDIGTSEFFTTFYDITHQDNFRSKINLINMLKNNVTFLTEPK